MASLAEMRALAAARRQPSADVPVVAPNDDKDELLRSFRGEKAGAPALVEPVGAPAAAAPAAAALRHPRAQPARPPRRATCPRCARPVLLVGTTDAPVDPEPVRVLPREEEAARRLREPAWRGFVGLPFVFGWRTDDRRAVVGRVVPEGDVEIWRTHLETCPPDTGRRTSAWPDEPSGREMAKDAREQRWIERQRSGDDRG